MTSTLLQWRLDGSVVDMASLVVGELAANAAQHGRADMTLAVVLGPGVLEVTMQDRGDRREAPASFNESPDEHGRGFLIIDSLASKVEVQRHAWWHRVRVCLAVPPAGTG
nr:ATP-binding protein [Streptomyces sp. RP5T]